MRQFGNLCRRYRRADDDQQRNRRQPREQPDQHQRSADNLERPDEMRREPRMPEADPRKTLDTHLRIDELQDALREEDQSDGKPDEEDASVWGSLCHVSTFSPSVCQSHDSAIHFRARLVARTD